MSLIIFILCVGIVLNKWGPGMLKFGMENQAAIKSIFRR